MTTSPPAQSTHHDHVWHRCHQSIGRHCNHCEKKFETYEIRTLLNLESIFSNKIAAGPTGPATESTPLSRGSVVGEDAHLIECEYRRPHHSIVMIRSNRFPTCDEASKLKMEGPLEKFFPDPERDGT